MNSLQGLRASAAATYAAGLVCAGAFAFGMSGPFDLTASYPIAVGVTFAFIAAIGISKVDWHPFTSFGAANTVTMLRALLVSLIAGTLLVPVNDAVAWLVVALSIVVTVLDSVDGALARRMRIGSPFGARFDMEVDAFLIMVLAAFAWRTGKSGAWILASGLMRYAFVLAGMMLAWMTAPLPPSRRRQTVCVVQVVGLIVVAAPFVRPPLSSVGGAVALGVLLWSFLIDTRWLWQHRLQAAWTPAHEIPLAATDRARGSAALS
jgi:phosphatidylglycerophosphate synthase